MNYCEIANFTGTRFGLSAHIFTLHAAKRETELQPTVHCSLILKQHIH